jgi:biotin synthase-like enzyme
MHEALIKKAQAVYKQNFPLTTNFERAVFFSWYCATRDCAFCYMSAAQHSKSAVRSQESILAELILCRKLGWEIGFLSGGHEAYTKVRFLELLKNINGVLQEKIWINIGPLSKEELLLYKPYISGVVASIETINPVIHRKVCPSKPIKPFEEMLKDAGHLNLKKAMTIILGLGETLEDIWLLKDFITKYKIDKIHVYILNPQKGTIFENHAVPSAEYQAKWIAEIRIAFPKIDIQFGIWKDKVDRIALMLEAGANSISKFPALRSFHSEQAKELEAQVRKSGRSFTGTLTKFPTFDINEELAGLNINESLKAKIKIKLNQYVKGIR